MKLNELLKGIENFKVKGDLELEIKNIESNSKKISEGSLFVAIKGFDFDGHEFVSEAIEKGAVAVMLDLTANLKNVTIPKGITVIIAEDTRLCLAKMACNFYGNPSIKFK